MISSPNFWASPLYLLELVLSRTVRLCNFRFHDVYLPVPLPKGGHTFFVVLRTGTVQLGLSPDRELPWPEENMHSYVLAIH